MDQQPLPMPPEEPTRPPSQPFQPPSGPLPYPPDRMHPSQPFPPPPPSWQPPAPSGMVPGYAYPQMAPPPPSGLRGTWFRYRRARRPFQVLIGCGAALALVLVCLCALIALGAAVGGNNTAQATPTPGIVLGQTPVATQASSPTVTQPPTPTLTPTPTLSPTPTFTPTPTPPHPVEDATFGGREDDFIVKYGQPVFSDKAVRHYHFTAPDGSTALLVIQIFDQSSSDGKQHVYVINIGPLQGGSAWSASLAKQAYKLFLPKDAKFLKDKTISNLGTYHIYVSANLGATFPADNFTDTTGKQVALGTFWVNCSGTSAGGCVFMLGGV